MCESPYGEGGNFFPFISHTLNKRVGRWTVSFFAFPQIAKLLERDSKKYRATVELLQTREILTMDYDDLCEYTGDVEDF